MDNILKNSEKYNLNKKCKKFIVFEGMIADMLKNKNIYLIVTELSSEQEN